MRAAPCRRAVTCCAPFVATLRYIRTSRSENHTGPSVLIDCLTLLDANALTSVYGSSPACAASSGLSVVPTCENTNQGESNEAHWTIVGTNNRVCGGELCSGTVDCATGYRAHAVCGCLGSGGAAGTQVRSGRLSVCRRSRHGRNDQYSRTMRPSSRTARGSRSRHRGTDRTNFQDQPEQKSQYRRFWFSFGHHRPKWGQWDHRSRRCRVFRR